MLTRALVEVEGWFEEKCEKVDQVLLASKTSQLSLSLLVLLLVLGLFVKELLIPDLAHLFGVAVLNVQSILRLEEDILCEFSCKLALVLLLKVDEGLLSARNDLDLIYFTL
jgi:hypothetical protein